MKFFVAHDDCSTASFAELGSNARFITEEELATLNGYKDSDSRSSFTSYVHSTKEATICEINDLAELKKVLEKYSEEHSWGGLINFGNAPLDCDGYIVLDIDFD